MKVTVNTNKNMDFSVVVLYLHAQLQLLEFPASKFWKMFFEILKENIYFVMEQPYSIRIVQEARFVQIVDSQMHAGYQITVL